MQKTILKIDGIFLIVMGTLAAMIDLISYFLGKGPFAQVYFQNSITIGGFEAHCLAVIAGFILFSKSKGTGELFFNKIALAIHGVLGISNIIWFNVFSDTGTLPMGYLTTVAHFLLAALHIMVISKSARVAVLHD